MADRPYTLLSCSMSLDGYLDGATVKRLPLSNEADLDRVDAVRADADAILVGAATVRNDNPRLVIRSAQRQAARVAHGRPPSPIKVTVTGQGRLDLNSQFFTCGDAQKLVYCARAIAAELRDRMGCRAMVVDCGPQVNMSSVSEDLFARGVQRLMVEGGQHIHTQFLTNGLADELHLVIAPFFVGDSRARRFVGDGEFPWHMGRRAELADVRRIDDVVLLRYALSDRFEMS